VLTLFWMCPTAERVIETTEQYHARGQLLRARGLLLQGRGAMAEALGALAASAAVYRAQHEFLQLGLTLTALATAAFEAGNATMVAQAEAEIAQLVTDIGPGVRVLPWARSSRSAASRPSSAIRRQSQAVLRGVLTRREGKCCAM
jgi:hypothetical protein